MDVVHQKTNTEAERKQHLRTLPTVTLAYPQVLPVFTIFDGEQLTAAKCVPMFAWPLFAFLRVEMPMWTKMCYVHRVLVNRKPKLIKHISSIMNSAVVSGIIVALGARIRL